MWTTAKNETWDKNAEKWGGRKQQRELFNLRDDSRELFTLRWKMTAQRTAYIERGGENRQNCLSWGGGENRENYLLWGGRWEQRELLRGGGRELFTLRGRWEQRELFPLMWGGEQKELFTLRWEVRKDRTVYLEVEWNRQFFVQHGLEVRDEHSDWAAHKLLLQLSQLHALAAVTTLLGAAAHQHTHAV